MLLHGQANRQIISVGSARVAGFGFDYWAGMARRSKATGKHTSYGKEIIINDVRSGAITAFCCNSNQCQDTRHILDNIKIMITSQGVRR